MAETVETYVREILDNVQVIEATRKAAQEEKVLAAIRTASGTAGVKAYRQVTAEAKKAAAEVERAAKKAAAAEERAARGPSEWTKALQANTEAVRNSAKELGEFRSKVNLGAEGLGKLGAAASVISPELAGVAGTVQKLTGAVSAGTTGLELFGGTAIAAIGPIAGIAAVAYAALDHMSEGVDDLRQESDDLGESLERLRGNLKNITKAQEELDLRRLKAEGKEDQATKIETEAKATELYSESIAATNAELGTLIERRKALEATQERPGLLDTLFGPGSAKTSEDLREVNGQIAAAKRRLAEYGAEQGNYATDLTVVVDLEKKNEDAKKKTADAEREAAQAARERRREEEAALKDALDYLAKEEKAEREMWERSAMARADRERAAVEAKQKELDDYNAMLRAEGEADAKALAEREAAYEKSFADRAKAEQDYISNLTGSFGSASAVFGQFYDNMTADTENMTDEQKEAALRLWNIQKALAVAEIEMNTIKSVSAALATPPAPNLILGGLALALGTAQAVAANTEPAPTFTDTPPGGYRFTGESNTIQGATNDTAILFRDPLEGFQQALDVLSRRQAPTSTPARDRRPLLGKQLATTPVARLLTRDAERLTRGRI